MAVLIFSMSAQDGATSSQQSVQVAKIVARAVTPGFDSLPGPERENVIENYHHLTRKGAHVLEYAMLCLFLTLALNNLEKWRAVSIAWGASTLYAVIDEFHQLSVPGRGAQLTDVLIDAGGAALGGVAALALLYIWRRIERGRNLSKH